MDILGEPRVTRTAQQLRTPSPSPSHPYSVYCKALVTITAPMLGSMQWCNPNCSSYEVSIIQEVILLFTQNLNSIISQPGGEVYCPIFLWTVTVLMSHKQNSRQLFCQPSDKIFAWDKKCVNFTRPTISNWLYIYSSHTWRERRRRRSSCHRCGEPEIPWALALHVWWREAGNRLRGERGSSRRRGESNVVVSQTFVDIFRFWVGSTCRPSGQRYRRCGLRQDATGENDNYAM